MVVDTPVRIVTATMTMPGSIYTSQIVRHMGGARVATVQSTVYRDLPGYPDGVVRVVDMDIGPEFRSVVTPSDVLSVTLPDVGLSADTATVVFAH